MEDIGRVIKAFEGTINYRTVAESAIIAQAVILSQYSVGCVPQIDYRDAILACNYEAAIQCALTGRTSVLCLIRSEFGDICHYSRILAQVCDRELAALLFTFLVLRHLDARQGNFSPLDNLEPVIVREDASPPLKYIARFENIILHGLPRPISTSVIDLLRRSYQNTFISADNELELMRAIPSAPITLVITAQEIDVIGALTPIARVPKCALATARDNKQYVLQGPLAPKNIRGTLNIDNIARRVLKIPRSAHEMRLARINGCYYVSTQVTTPLVLINPVRESSRDFIINCAFRLVMGLVPTSASSALFRGPDGAILSLREIHKNDAVRAHHNINASVRAIIISDVTISRILVSWRGILRAIHAFESAVCAIEPSRAELTGISIAYLANCIARIDDLVSQCVPVD